MPMAREYSGRVAFLEKWSVKIANLARQMGTFGASQQAMITLLGCRLNQRFRFHIEYFAYLVKNQIFGDQLI